MSYNVSNNQEFDLQLMINILLEEHQIDRLTAFELQKKSEVYCFEDLGIELIKDSKIDIKQIYDIIKREGIPSGNYYFVKIKTISRLRSLIGKWHSPTEGQMKLPDVLDDIYYRIVDQIQGEQYYFTGKPNKPVSKGRYSYKLFIHDNITFFINLNNEKAYRIIWEGDFNDKLCNL